MNQRVSVILVVALVISAAATYGVYRIIAARASDRTTIPTVHIVQAARTLDVGTIVKDDDLKLGLWAGTVPPGLAVKKDGLIGRGVLSQIYEGEAVMDSRLAPPGGGGGLAATIPNGMRAVAVRVNDVAGVAGFVGPGTKVDIVLSGNPPGIVNASGQQARTILQNIQVLSAGQNYKTDAEGKPVVVPVVNLLVTPDQAEVLSLVNNGNDAHIQLVLRNPLDSQEAKTSGTAMANLFGSPPRVLPVAASSDMAVRTVIRKPKPEMMEHMEPPPPPPPPISIEIFNGAKQSEAKFARTLEVKQ
ncbi:MAG TPA: Flp pilus assembly protein CpaB [Candidatus Sulfopaludibacter sp.]|jgi:pilus assembly protein CpaB|nr:Flp pilus assembly protein CpaB [Candidatus Sulfopaludibacter sp.]